METDIRYGPAYSLAFLRLDAGETVMAEAGAMVSMSANVGIETSSGAGGGLKAALKRSVLGGESFFMNRFTAEGGPGEVTVAPPVPGDIVSWPIEGQTVLLQSGSYLASSDGVEVDTKWGGAKSFFSKEGLFLLKVSGAGELLVASYGAIHPIDLEAGESYVLDTGHMVAFSEGVDYQVRKVGGLKSTLLSGEGLVAEFTGPGRVYLQTRSADAFVDWLAPLLPEPRSNS